MTDDQISALFMGSVQLSVGTLAGLISLTEALHRSGHIDAHAKTDVAAAIAGNLRQADAILGKMMPSIGVTLNALDSWSQPD